MKSVIKWAINNSPAMNSLLIAGLLCGAASLIMMRREIFPEFELDVILITVPYPGAPPEEVEEGICQKIEEAVQGIDGIKRMTSIAKVGSGFVILELDAKVDDTENVINEVRSEIDQITSMPELAEDPDVKEITFRLPAIRIAVLAPENTDPADEEAEFALRDIAEGVRDDLLQLQPMEHKNPVRRKLSKLPRSVVSSVSILGAKDYQIDIEIPEENLRKHNLTLKQVAQIVRQQNLELPGGSIKTAGQEVLVVGKDKTVLGREIEDIEILTEPTVLKIRDLGTVSDGFNDTTMISEVDGRPALVVSADRTSDEDLLFLVDNVKHYVAQKNKELPPGYELRTWYDQSIDVKDRMDMLIRNGLQGLILVFLVLAIFLELRLAFWVALGVPIAVLGAGAVLLMTGQTLNMLSMFAFLMALGIVVDDAIVIGENIFEHRQRGKGFVRAAIDGTYEVLPSVAASVSTTIIAFLPLSFVAGVMGKFIAVMPVAVIAMLIISLIESTFILPCHLAHEDNLVFRIIGIVFYPFKFLVDVFRWLNQQVGRLLAFVIGRTYLPTLRWALNNPLAIFAGAIGLLLLSFGFVASGITPFVVFPKLDTRFIEASVVYPDGTPANVTEAATRRLEQSFLRLNEEYESNGMPLLLLRHRVVGEVNMPGAAGPSAVATGSHLGRVTVELVAPSDRNLKSDEIIEMWRKAAGDFPGAESVAFKSESFGPGGTPIEFKLIAQDDHVDELEQAVEKCKKKLTEYKGVFDVEDDSRPGKWEMQLKVKDSAKTTGVLQAELSETVRASFYGEEVMRLQRGRHEVKLMVRYPENERTSYDSLEDVRIRRSDGESASELPFSEVADVNYKRGISEINRVDQRRSITISADAPQSRSNDIVQDLRQSIEAGFLDEFPNVQVRWEGQEDQRKESLGSLKVGFIVAMLAMYVLLTLEFRSYAQPLIILAIIPFGFIGAVVGHAVMRLDITLFSIFGLVALTGVVINDSIVLVDFINHRIQDGLPLKQAIIEAGRRRFRPVLLTSITTIAGLVPLLLETSFQAQVLIPMATSLCFGLLLATGLVLVLVPTFFYVYARLFLHLRRDELDDQEASDDNTKLDDTVDEVGEPLPV
jgi:HAE1 family hydrophobic/amphiphilic exporter-1